MCQAVKSRMEREERTSDRSKRQRLARGSSVKYETDQRSDGNNEMDQTSDRS
jgi:hypothetical protein